MTQSQLAKAIAKEFFLSQVDAAAILDSILAKMTASLQKGERPRRISKAWPIYRTQQFLVFCR